MKASDVLKEIRQALKQTKVQGHATVSIDAMENYLMLFDKDVENDTYYKSQNHEAQLAKFKAENDRSIAHANNETAHSLEMFKSVITAGQSALKSSMVVNGGAAAALLAFTGKIWETSTSELVANSLTSSIFIFCLGVLCAALATGTTYLSQMSFANGWLKLGHSINTFNIAVVLSSYGLFCFGAFKAANSLGVHFGL
ncbi:hypothetical protein [Colwellia psychrerythraea]|uniref:Uncharacterized protein n=1 Tax=Colwellia psychrerythraea (strain 34H / ATCC BAA-681) TaxID=167879 RepID=Q48AF2_COLP3|nr:hypothetical protein [Colwellia psychrerythraea]AAZ28418.1 hypothetical protein CPS_0193 [Colwellia psychrerythraea 34H]